MSPLGLEVVSSATLTGGVSSALLADGREVILKRSYGEGATITEAASLRWLAETGTVPLPEVLAVDDEWLALPKIPAGQPNQAAAEEFGRALARMHAAGADAFGSAPPGASAHAWIGTTEMRNVEADSWPRWFAETRVLPFVRRAGVRLPAVERVCERIEDFAGPQEEPARLHGDLWWGNVFWAADGNVWLIDPAAHGGHRETDLAMLQQFGCPMLDRILAAYQEVLPLADGWRERIPLHQLFPLTVHNVLFGGDYGAQAEAAARSLLR